MVINANRGMYIEQLVERTIDFYNCKNICHIEKRHIPLKIIKKINETTAVAKILTKSFVDYFGTINGKYVEFECKQTVNEYFDLNLIKSHQWEYLNTIGNYQNSLSFIIICFEKIDSIILIDTKTLKECHKQNKNKKIPYNLLIKYGIKLEIIYPGIIDIHNGVSILK